MTYDEMLVIAHGCKDKALRTVTGKEFRVGVYMDCPFFIPQSTRQGRSDGRAAAERFLERYNATGSLSPGDYQSLTHNASYFVVLVQQGK